MKTIGLIGGMSWESSKVYYEMVNTMVKEKLGGSHSCKSIMISVDFAEIERLSFANQWEEIGDMMSKCARQLQQAGADVILLCTNTIHLVSERIVASIDIPFLHIAHTTGQEIKHQQINKVGLLGTKFTMEKTFYTDLLKNDFEIETVVPEEADRQIIHDMIYQELVNGRFSNESKAICKEVIQRLIDRGCQGVILGCTELPILMSGVDLPAPTFDTGKIHAEAAVNWALESMKAL